jgi:peroxin-6
MFIILACFLSNIVILYQIDCYDILGESKAETEGFLRTRFDQAKACTPCIVVLRRLEALSQTTQALEPNKGNASPNL